MDSDVRWTVRISRDTDFSVRSFLARKGMKKRELLKFIEEAVRGREFDQTVAETKARNAGASLKEIDAAIEEALGAVRADRTRAARK